MARAKGATLTTMPKGLVKPAQRALTQARFSPLEQLTKATEAEVGGLHGIGPRSRAQIHEALAANGMSFEIAKKASQ
jgi:hypothetical protein